MQLSWKGEQQEGRVGKPLEPFEVLVTDEAGDRVPHVPVEFTVAEGSGTFTYKDEITDLGGNAIAEFVPAESGRYRVECFLGEGAGRKMVPFKGSVKPDRRKSATIHPPAPRAEPAKAAAPPAQPAPQVILVVALPPAAPVVAKPLPTPAREAKPPQPAPVSAAPTARAAAARPSPVTPAKPAPRPQPRPRRRQPTRQPASEIRGLLIAVIAVFALLVPFSIVLVIQELGRPAQPRPPALSLSCASSRIEADVLVFRDCSASLR